MAKPEQLWLDLARPGPSPHRARARERNGRVAIEADYSEDVSGIPAMLGRAGAWVRRCRLPAGDYLVGHRFLVERKAAGDFARSLFDGRLLAQLRYLKRSVVPCLLVVEGCPGYYERFWPPKLRPVLLSAALDFRVPVLFTRRPEGTVELLLALGRRCLTFPAAEFFVPAPRRKRPDKRERAFVEFWRALESIPLVGPAAAMRLAGRFGSLESLRRASVAELSRVRGVGPLRAGNIRAALREKS
ncbi:MAG: ERCC4 domain-containing protein [Elusimicrobiota bacterium]